MKKEISDHSFIPIIEDYLQNYERLMSDEEFADQWDNTLHQRFSQIVLDFSLENQLFHHCKEGNLEEVVRLVDEEGVDLDCFSEGVLEKIFH